MLNAKLKEKRSSKESPTENPVREKSFAFALETVRLCHQLQDQKEFILSAQLLKAGTSVGANIEEAIAGQSKKDFTAKMAIASKEARETRYWLRLLKESGTINTNLEPHLSQIDELIRILTAIVKTSQHSRCDRT